MCRFSSTDTSSSSPLSRVLNVFSVQCSVFFFFSLTRTILHLFFFFHSSRNSQLATHSFFFGLAIYIHCSNREKSSVWCGYCVVCGLLDLRFILSLLFCLFYFAYVYNDRFLCRSIDSQWIAPFRPTAIDCSAKQPDSTNIFNEKEFENIHFALFFLCAFSLSRLVSSPFRFVSFLCIHLMRLFVFSKSFCFHKDTPIIITFTRDRTFSQFKLSQTFNAF